VFLYAVALGFKESAVVGPALIVLVDWFFLSPQSESRNRLSYLTFLIPLAVFGWFVYSYPQGRFRVAEAAHSGYGISDAIGVVLAESRSALNLLLPFEPPFALRDIGFSLALKIAIVMILLGSVVALTPSKKVWLFAGLWIFVALLPTSMFARAKNLEYYVFFAGFGLAAAIGIAVRDITESRSGRFATYAVIATLFVYCAAGALRLKKYENEWKQAAGTVQQFIAATAAVLPPSVFMHVEFVNVPHDVSGIPVLNNGLLGALIARGYGSGLTVMYDHDVAEVGQSDLVAAVDACSMTEPQNDHRVLLVKNLVVTDHTSRCARDAIAEDVRLRPWVWVTDSLN
jgi:hypothetical protein